MSSILSKRADVLELSRFMRRGLGILDGLRFSLDVDTRDPGMTRQSLGCRSERGEDVNFGMSMELGLR